MTMTVMRTLGRIAYEWGVRLFPADMADSTIRGTRVAEEAIELAQSLGATRETIHKLVDHVYNRPRGEAIQEIGGCYVTLGVLCHLMGRDPESIFEREVCRVLSKDGSTFVERNKEKHRLGLV